MFCLRVFRRKSYASDPKTAAPAQTSLGKAASVCFRCRAATERRKAPLDGTESEVDHRLFRKPRASHTQRKAAPVENGEHLGTFGRMFRGRQKPKHNAVVVCAVVYTSINSFRNRKRNLTGCEKTASHYSLVNSLSGNSIQVKGENFEREKTAAFSPK
ncbi:glycoside hydrolase family 43 [Anopheles sinensis]|uniref:Glycoside hydrolase family 43 n=1 Tax=Anopheles sinensis TaxID=74873 RepID=A0A084WUA9_ANOSI|nr:glycoside hydrolase family 43 [Anopheles sinensis]